MPGVKLFGMVALRLPVTVAMLDLLEAYGLYALLKWPVGSCSPYITSADAERILDAVPREGRTGMALRRRCKALLRRWDQCAS